MKITDSARTVLCFGDSNTWGAIPKDDPQKDDSRYPRSIRWPSALQELLGENYEIISEGLRGRTFVAPDWEKPHRTGYTHLRALLESCDPLDLVIMMLGTNDIKEDYGLSARGIAKHLEQTVKLIRDKKIVLQKRPALLIVCPPSPVTPKTRPIDKRLAGWPELFRDLPALYKKVAKEYECAYLSAGSYISSSAIDGFHLDRESHLKLAEVIAAKVKKIKI